MVCNWNLGPFILGFLLVALLFIFFSMAFLLSVSLGVLCGFLGCVVLVSCVLYIWYSFLAKCVLYTWYSFFLTNDTPIPLRSRKRYLIFYFLMYCPFKHMLNAFEIYNHVFHAVVCICSILKVTSLLVYSGLTGAW